MKVNILETIKLKLVTKYILESLEVTYKLITMSNFLSISLLDKQIYSSIFGNKKFKLYKNGRLIGCGIFWSSLYQFDLYGNICLNFIVNNFVAHILILSVQELMIILLFCDISI